MRDQEYLEVVNKLNDIIQDGKNPVDVFRYTTDGYHRYIMFGYFCIWNGEDDYPDEIKIGPKIIMEDFYDAVVRKFNEWQKEILEIKL